jgi:hypothetical protein
MRPWKSIQFSNSGVRVIALVLTTSLLCFGQASKTPPSLGKFAGTWTEDESKRTFGPTETLKFRLDAKGNLEELRGADARPLVQAIRFDGKPYAIDASNNTIAWKQIDKDHFKRELFENAKLLTTRDIQVSGGGKTLTEETARTLLDGEKSVTTIKYHRTKGEGQGLAGIWQEESYHSTVPAQWKYEVMGERLKMMDNTGVTFTLAPDSKPVEVTGPAVISGTMAALKQIGPDKMEIAQSRQGVPTGKIVLALSDDDKVLTLSAINLAPNASREPSVTVFQKK